MLILSGILLVVAIICFLLAFLMDGEEGVFVLFGVLGIIAAGFLFCIAYVREENAARNAFMTECVQYRKQYECTYMWRNSEADSNTVIPVVVPVR